MADFVSARIFVAIYATVAGNTFVSVFSWGVFVYAIIMHWEPGKTRDKKSDESEQIKD